MFRTEQDALNVLVSEQKRTNELLEKILAALIPREVDKRRNNDGSNKQKSTSVRSNGGR